LSLICVTALQGRQRKEDRWVRIYQHRREADRPYDAIFSIWSVFNLIKVRLRSVSSGGGKA